MTYQQFTHRFLDRKPKRGTTDEGVKHGDDYFVLNVKTYDQSPTAKYNYTFDIMVANENPIVIYIHELKTYWIDAEARLVGQRRHSALGWQRAINARNPNARVMLFPFRLLHSLASHDARLMPGTTWRRSWGNRNAIPWRSYSIKWLLRALNSISLLPGAADRDISIDAMRLSNHFYTEWKRNTWTVWSNEAADAVFNSDAETALKEFARNLKHMTLDDYAAGIKLRDIHMHRTGVERNQPEIITLSPEITYQAAVDGQLPPRFKDIAIERMKLYQQAVKVVADSLKTKYPLQHHRQDKDDKISGITLKAMTHNYTRFYSEKQLENLQWSDEQKQLVRDTQEKLFAVLPTWRGRDAMYLSYLNNITIAKNESGYHEAMTYSGELPVYLLTEEEQERHDVAKVRFHRPSGIAFKYYRPRREDRMKDNITSSFDDDYNLQWDKTDDSKPKIKLRTEYWASGSDEAQFFLSRLPKIQSTQTIDEDFMPKIIKQALSTDVKRQGDWYFLYHSKLEGFAKEIGVSVSRLKKEFVSAALPSNKVEGNLHVVKQFKYKGQIYCIGNVYHRDSSGRLSREHRRLQLGMLSVYTAHQNTAIINFSATGRGVD